MEQSSQQNQTPPVFNPEPLREIVKPDTKTLLGAVLFLLLFAFLFRGGFPGREIASVFAPFIQNAEIVKPQLASRAYLVARLNTGEVLFEQEKDASLPIASITKLFTADLFLSYFQDSLELMPFSDGALQKKFSDEKLSGVAAEERVKAEDILWLMLVASANDAARAAAEAVAFRAFPDLQYTSYEEKIASFVRLMNERTASLGMTHTHFANSDGLDDSEHYSSASDLFVFAKIIMQEKPEIFEISRRVSSGVAGSSGTVYRFDNTNRILAKYPKIIGSKTGSTKDAKETLVLLYELFPDDPVFIALLGSENRDMDAEATIQWLENAFVKEAEDIQ